jgi:type II secretory pathway pseudopilin PulG
MGAARISLVRKGRQSGFSLFELIVYMLISSIMFATAFNRYRGYPAEAERANFTAILGQLKTGVNMQMIVVIASGAVNERVQLAGSNPMDLMLQTPGNYLGTFSSVDENQLPRRTWYFDSSLGQLIYLADRSDNLFSVTPQGRIPTNRIKLHIIDIYEEYQFGRRWQGVALEPVEPYEWFSQGIELPLPQQPEVPALDERLMELVDSQL